MKEPLTSLRIDKWLWAARFFKTRALAQTAIDGGKVHINNQRSKPSRHVQVGDVLEITRGHSQQTVSIVALNDQRRPFEEARLLYQESASSLEKREKDETLRQLNAIPHSQDKPNKHQRKEIQRLKGKW